MTKYEELPGVSQNSQMAEIISKGSMIFAEFLEGVPVTSEITPES